MSSKAISVLVIVSILAFMFTTAFKPPREVDISLLAVSYKREKGVTFKFYVEGDVRKSDLRGKVYVNDRTLRLYCNYFGDPTPLVVTCTSAKATAKFAGLPAIVSVAGHSFYFIVPARSSRR